jgi:hypothetical protein
VALTLSPDEKKAAFRFIDGLIALLKKYDQGYGSKQQVNRANGHSYNHIYKFVGKKLKSKDPHFSTVVNILEHYEAWNEKEILARLEESLKARYEAWEKEKMEKGVRKGKKG